MLRSITRFAVLLCAAFSCAVFAADAGLTVDDPYVRLAPPGAQTTGAFMTIHNSGSVDRKLVKAESSAAKTVQLHNHINENGVMKMRQVDSIDVKANAQAELKPGSYHVMLIDMTAPLKEGDTVPITLIFDDGTKTAVAAPVRKQAMSMPVDKTMRHSDMAN